MSLILPVLKSLIIPHSFLVTGAQTCLRGLSDLQEHIKTPVCLDESVVTAQDMEEAMDFDNLKCYALKVANLEVFNLRLTSINGQESKAK